MPAHIKSLLVDLNLQSDNWLKQILTLGQNNTYAIGSIEKLKEKAKSLSKKWLKGLSATKLLYAKT